MTTALDAAPLVKTTGGIVRGTAPRGQPLRFLGIPYAEPPVGPLRFMPPRPARRWSGIRDASAFGPAAAQVYDPHESDLADFGVESSAAEPTASPVWVGSEDCLTLNVWTPALKGPQRPVLVWIHGGANWLESSRLSCYHGDALAARGNVVVVSFNYRLGIFGFLDLSVLGDERLAGSHAHGLRDQLLALLWVRENIARFGGDPACITLAGESAGSMNITWLATTGRLQGLVQRVVLMSGVASVVGYGNGRDGEHPAHDAHGLAEGQRRAREFLGAIGIGDATTLRGLSTDALLRRHADHASRSDMLFDLDTLFYPRVDGHFTRCTPFDAISQGGYDGLQALVGHTAYEMGLWLQWDDGLDAGTAQAMAQRLPHFPEAARTAIAEQYDRWYAAEPPGVRAMLLLGDACFVMPSVLLADLLVERRIPVWMYQFQWAGSDPRRRAQHAADQGFFFGTQDSTAARLIVGRPRDITDARERTRMSLVMQDALLAFVASGDPGSAGEAGWPAYAAQRSVMCLDAPACRAVPGLLDDRSAWWAEHVYRRTEAR